MCNNIKIYFKYKYRKNKYIFRTEYNLPSTGYVRNLVSGYRVF
jgi:hypothetical protein